LAPIPPPKKISVPNPLHIAPAPARPQTYRTSGTKGDEQNAYEALARHEKALLLADALDALHCTSADVAALLAEDWDLLQYAAIKAGPETKQLVVEMLERRELARTLIADNFFGKRAKRRRAV
jgi:hypothetical protein